ncbi:hypothetical protein [Methylomarinum vadi]|uniref:hypothetical protein n=1 Tax=Methylomarinum vadi TaxID=438855 RepID=UPI0004DF9C21|nr:hypothetical protein [Methylomarinum vadi]
MQPVTLPNPIRILCSSLASWWLAHSMNPGFFAVATMLLLMIPLWATELLLSLAQTAHTPNKKATDKDSVKENTA